MKIKFVRNYVLNDTFKLVKIDKGSLFIVEEFLVNRVVINSPLYARYIIPYEDFKFYTKLEEK